MTLKHFVQQDDLNISSLIICNYIIPTLFTIAGWINSTVINMLEHSLQGHITPNIDIRPGLQYLCKYIPKYYNVQILLYQTQHLMQLLKWTSLTLLVSQDQFVTILALQISVCCNINPVKRFDTKASFTRERLRLCTVCVFKKVFRSHAFVSFNVSVQTRPLETL